MHAHVVFAFLPRLTGSEYEKYNIENRVHFIDLELIKVGQADTTHESFVDCLFEFTPDQHVIEIFDHGKAMFVNIVHRKSLVIYRNCPPWSVNQVKIKIVELQ